MAEPKVTIGDAIMQDPQDEPSYSLDDILSMLGMEVDASGGKTLVQNEYSQMPERYGMAPQSGVQIGEAQMRPGPMQVDIGQARMRR